MSEEPKAAPDYNTPIPSNITTPDKVDTRIGTLEFFDGFPSQETTRKVFDNLDFLRGVEVFLNGIPMTSLEGLRASHESMGAVGTNQMLIADQLLDSDPLFLTGNTDTVYRSSVTCISESLLLYSQWASWRTSCDP
jgi:hypothetical protein